MKAKRTILALLSMVAILAGCTGILAGTIYVQDVHSEMPAAHLAGGYESSAPDGKACPYGLPAEYTIGLLYAKAAGPSFGSPGISRARGQVYQNENRSQIIKYLAENPGSRLYDIMKTLNMNIGTTRYHLMILSLNHVLIPYQEGAGQIRYFTNNGSYTGDGMKIISLLKREPTRKLLRALAGQAGMTNANISVASGLPCSDVTRYLKELTAKGVVVKEPLGRDKYQYRIAPDLEDCVADHIGTGTDCLQ
jgi:DNA-binding MarR family transcriptional regulator